MATKKANSAKTELQKIQENNNKTTIELQKLANANTAKTFEYNTKEAEASRKWQTEMSNTSHQREVADLKKAGLNPVLSANQGAQSYTTSSANAQADNSAVSAVAGIKQSETNARSSMYGADQSLKASQSVASAQRYAADRAYQASLASAAAARYSADRHYEAQKYTADKNYAAVMDKPQGTWASVVDKYLGSAIANGIKNVAKESSFNSKITGVSKNEVQKYIGEPNAYAALSAVGRKRVDSFLKANNYALTTANVSLVSSFLLSGSIKFLSRLTKNSSYSKYSYYSVAK